MQSSLISDSENFSLFGQTIPGTYNKYDRKVIKDDIQLEFPKKLKINNWPERLRWKSHIKFPPRPRAVMIQTIEEKTEERIRRYGQRVDFRESVKRLYKNVMDVEVEVKSYDDDGNMINLAGDGTLDPKAQATKKMSIREIVRTPSVIARMGTMSDALTRISLDPSWLESPQLMQATEFQLTADMFNLLLTNPDAANQSQIDALRKSMSKGVTLRPNQIFNKYRHFPMDAFINSTVKAANEIQKLFVRGAMVNAIRIAQMTPEKTINQLRLEVPTLFVIPPPRRRPEPPPTPTLPTSTPEFSPPHDITEELGRKIPLRLPSEDDQKEYNDSSYADVVINQTNRGLFNRMLTEQIGASDLGHFLPRNIVDISWDPFVEILGKDRDENTGISYDDFLATFNLFTMSIQPKKEDTESAPEATPIAISGLFDPFLVFTPQQFDPREGVFFSESNRNYIMSKIREEVGRTGVPVDPRFSIDDIVKGMKPIDEIQESKQFDALDQPIDMRLGDVNEAIREFLDRSYFSTPEGKDDVDELGSQLAETPPTDFDSAPLRFFFEKILLGYLVKLGYNIPAPDTIAGGLVPAMVNTYFDLFSTRLLNMGVDPTRITADEYAGETFKFVRDARNEIINSFRDLILAETTEEKKEEKKEEKEPQLKNISQKFMEMFQGQGMVSYPSYQESFDEAWIRTFIRGDDNKVMIFIRFIENYVLMGGARDPNVQPNEDVGSFGNLEADEVYDDIADGTMRIYIAGKKRLRWAKPKKGK